MRVHELAKSLKIDSRELVRIAKELKLDVANTMTNLSEEEVITIKNHIKNGQVKHTSQKQKTKTVKSNEKSDVKEEKKEEKEKKVSSSKEKTKSPVQKPKEKSKEKKAKKNDATVKSKKKIQEIPEVVLDQAKPAKRKERKAKKEKVNQSSNQRKKRDLTKKTGIIVSKKKAQKREAKAPKDSGNKVYKIEFPLTVKDFANATERSTADIITTLMKLGIMANINQNIDEEVGELLALELDIEIEMPEPEEELDLEELFGLNQEDDEKDLIQRAPIITVMGHVDHGKTSLLDKIKSTKVTAGEAGGITQHIGAYQVRVKDRKLTFLDTPGHEAFTMMRMRGTQITDIAILVVAANDGIMPQTIEAISHAKSAKVPIIVAINKMDLAEANAERVKQELTEHDLLPEEWGGETIVVPVSAKTGEGIDELLEMVVLLSDILDLKANPQRPAVASVIDAKLDVGRGPVATVLIQSGTLRIGDSVASGKTSGRIRHMINDKGKSVTKAGPSMPVEIQGLSDVPNAGDHLYVFEDEKQARNYAEKVNEEERKDKLKGYKVSLDDLFQRIAEGELKDLNIIIKGDVKGSIEALSQSILKLSTDEVKINIVHAGVGGITESDVLLASTSDAIIIGFNVRPNNNSLELAKREDVEIRTYTVIYKAIEDLEAAVKGMHAPKFVENFIGRVEVRDTFKLPNGSMIAGGYVISGKITRDSKVKILRDDYIIHEGEISSLRRFQDDVREVASGYECGIGIENYNDIKVGDIIEASIMEEVEN